jgi:O-antigen/teichoic acid export membrane protein
LTYGVSVLIAQSMAVLLLPIYTRTLTPGEYGLLEICVLLVGVLERSLPLKLDQALIRAYIFKDELEAKLTGVQTAFSLQLAVGVIAAILIFIQAPTLARMMLETEEHALLIRVVAGIAFFKLLYSVPLALFRTREQSVWYGVINIVNFSVVLLATIGLVVIARLGASGAISGVLLGSVAAATLALFLVRRELDFSVSLSLAKELLRYGLPIVPAALSAYAIHMSDRLFLQHYASLEVTGQYAVGYKLGMGVSLVVGALQTAWPPIMFSIYKNNEKASPVIFAKLFNYIAALLVLLVLAVSLLSEELVLLLATVEYRDAAAVVPLIAVSYAVYGMYLFSGPAIELRAKTQFIPIVVGAAAATSLGLNFLLIPRFGMMGAAVATLSSFFVMLVSKNLFSQRIIKIPYDWLKIALIYLLALVAYGLGLQFYLSSFWLTLLAKAVLLATFAVLVFLIVTTPTEREQLKLRAANIPSVLAAIFEMR